MRTVTDVQAVPHLRGGRVDLTWSLPPSSDYDPGRGWAASSSSGASARSHATRATARSSTTARRFPV